MPTNYYSNSFQSDVTTVLRTAVQQEGSFLEKTVTKTSYRGAAAQVADFVKKAPNPIRNQPSKADTQYSDIDTTRRWIYGNTLEEAILIDQYDKLRTLNDPSSQYVKVIRDAHGRGRDTEIITGIFADARTGVTGGTTTTFDAANTVGITVGASGNTGMNLAKITAAKQRLMFNRVDVQREQLWMVVNSKIWADLVNDPEINNKMNGGLLDYKPVLLLISLASISLCMKTCRLMVLVTFVYQFTLHLQFSLVSGKILLL